MDLGIFCFKIDWYHNFQGNLNVHCGVHNRPILALKVSKEALYQNDLFLGNIVKLLLQLAFLDVRYSFIYLFIYTDSTKINRPGHNIRVYWTNFWQPTAHLKQDIFGKTLIEVCSLHLYASFGTFCVQIGQSFAPQWVFKHSEEFRNRRHFPSKTANCRFSNIIQRLIVPQIIDQFGRKRCQKKREDVYYKLLWELFQKYFVVHEHLAVVWNI